MYDSDRLNDLMDAILARGIDRDFERGFEFRTHKLHPDAPRSPIKFNLATRTGRDGGKLEEQDITLIGEIMYGYAKNRHLVSRAIAGIPNVGEKIAETLRNRVNFEEGNYIPLIPLTKIARAGGYTEIDRLVVTDALRKEYSPGQAVLVLDDVLTHATIGQSAVHRLRQAGYIVVEFLTLLSYPFDGPEVLKRLEVEAHSVLSVRDIVEYGKKKGKITPSEASQIMSFLEKMCDFLQTKSHRTTVPA
jgi:hypothetical protein